MDSVRTDDPPPLGLRERKKAKTRALIQAEALRLFRERGYDETSIEQIAEAAEVSPSTVSRYFPTKPDLVIYDDLDERMLEAFRALPPELNAVGAMRAMFRSAFGGLASDELALEKARAQLMRNVPEVRAAMLDEFARTLLEVADLVAERTGRRADDADVLALAGAVIGVSIAAWFVSEAIDWADYIERVDAGMAMLETGFRF